MANQSPDRREILAMLAKVAAVSQFPGFSKWVFASEHVHNEAPAARAAAYTPLFFNALEFKTADQLSELIIPRDDAPGAHDAGVVEFIDFMVAHDVDLQYPFRTGLAWLNMFAAEKYGSDFLSLSTGQQQSLVRKLAYRAEQSPTEIQGQEFFATFRHYTVLGYYTSRAGLEALDYPGLRLYSTSPECPHKNDPEHTHLAAPKF